MVPQDGVQSIHKALLVTVWIAVYILVLYCKINMFEKGEREQSLFSY